MKMLMDSAYPNVIEEYDLSFDIGTDSYFAVSSSF